MVKALAFPVKSTERKRELERLRLLGNFHGELIVMRRPTESETISSDESSIGVGGTSTFSKMCSYRPTPYYFPFYGYQFLISYFENIYVI